ncbi:MAG: hypothetical protein ACR2OD_08805 [Gaiellaceae bacterium]
MSDSTRDPLVILADTGSGVYAVELRADGSEDVDARPGATMPPRERDESLAPSWARSSLVDVDASGSTIVLLLQRRPPVLASYDGGGSWRERAGGVPIGVAIAVADNPDHVVMATETRLFVSLDGGQFWRSLETELDEITDVCWQ